MIVTAPPTETPLAGLRASSPTPLSFAPNLHVRGFLLEREHGNVLIYGAPGVGPETFGGADIARAYLGHRHEAGFSEDIAGVPLFVHEADAQATRRTRTVRGTFSRRHLLDDDLEVIPIPGHTPGATAYLWDNGAQRLLFTGDTIFLRDGRWTTAVLGSSDPSAYLESLALIRGLDFDVLVPWAATAGQAYFSVTSPVETGRRIDELAAEITISSPPRR